MLLAGVAQIALSLANLYWTTLMSDRYLSAFSHFQKLFSPHLSPAFDVV